MAKVALAAKRVDDAVAGGRPEQLHALDLVAEGQIGGTRVRDPALPGHLELPQLRQMAQHLEPAIGERAAGILVETKLLELRHTREMTQAIIAKFIHKARVGACEPQGGAG